MVELKDLTVGYGFHAVLEHISLSFMPGQITVLLGPNGCGKSTLLKAIVGLSDVLGGGIQIDGSSYVNFPSGSLAQKAAYLPQGRRIPDSTVERMVLHGRFPYLSYPRRYRKEDYAIAQTAMEQVGIAHLAQEPLSRLSGGTRQKVYIAMALAQDTPTILLDEPTTYLDIGHQLQLMELCRDLANRGKAVVLVLHDLPLALEYADTIALLQGGVLTAVGTPQQLLNSGRLAEVFGVVVQSLETPMGVRYFCGKM